MKLQAEIFLATVMSNFLNVREYYTDLTHGNRKYLVFDRLITNTSSVFNYVY